LLAAIGLALWGVAAVVRWPGPALLILVVFIPFQITILSTIYRLGAPNALVRPMGGVKELVTVGLTVAMLRHRKRHQWVGIDGLALLFLALTALGFVLPHLLPNTFPPVSFSNQLLGWRGDALFVLLFLAARHAEIPRAWVRRAVIAVLCVSAILVCGAIWESVATSSFNHFFTQTIRVGAYQADVLHDNSFSGPDLVKHVSLGSLSVLRVSSFLLTPLGLAFFLVLPVCLALAALLRTRPGWWPLPAMLAFAAVLILTVTRSAVLGAALAAMLLASAGLKAKAPGRTRLLILLGIALLAALPLAGSSHLIARSETSVTGTDTSTQLHIQRTTVAFERVFTDPFGSGLGTGAGIGQELQSGGVISENAYLQVGNTNGLPAMVAFVALTLVLIGLLRRKAMRSPGDWWLTALFGAAVGLAVIGLLQHVWLQAPITLTFWGLCGAALPAARTRESTIMAGFLREPVPDLDRAPALAAPRGGEADGG
jgi:hypothetical protein